MRDEEMIAPAYVVLLAEAVSILLFISMVAVWAALGAGA